METMPEQFFTHVGFTAPRLHSAHPPRKNLFSCHHFLAIVYSRLGAMIKVSVQSLFSQDSGGGRPDLHHCLVEVARTALWQELGRAEFHGARNGDLTLEGGSLHLGTSVFDFIFFLLCHLIIRMSSPAPSLTPGCGGRTYWESLLPLPEKVNLL